MSTDPVRVRQATAGDIPALVTLLEELFSIEEDFDFDEEKQGAGLSLLIGSDRASIIVAEEQETVIGMCSGQLTISTAEGGPALLVEDVVVARDRRSRGVGCRLMEEMCRWALLRGVSRLQLLADRSNAGARDFYRKTGWATTQLICLRKYIH